LVGWQSIVVPQKNPQKRIQNLVEPLAADIADGQLRRQPRRQNFRVKELMNEGRAIRKRKGELARGNVSLGMGASDEVRAREGLAFCMARIHG
jgi:hypothetical protein